MVAINYAYPIESFRRGDILDGKLIRGTKGNLFSGLVGKNVGAYLEDYTLKKTNRKIKVSLANDVVCLLLSSSLSLEGVRIGVVVGTGFNTGFWLNSKTIVNIESGNFDDFVMSESGKYVDENSSNCGKQKWEKEVSGAYLVKHYNYFARQNKLNRINKSRKLSEIANEEKGLPGEISRLLFMRSASLVAVTVAAISKFQSGEGELVIEGGVFWKGYNFVGYFIDYLKKLDINMSQTKILKYEDPYLCVAKLIIDL